MNWSALGFDSGGVAMRFDEQVVAPIRRLAGTTIDVWAVLAGILMPWVSIGDRVAANYRRYLFGSQTLQNLPDKPRFVINATNAQSGALWRFMKPYMRDYRVGEVRAADDNARHGRCRIVGVSTGALSGSTEAQKRSVHSEEWRRPSVRAVHVAGRFGRRRRL